MQFKGKSPTKIEYDFGINALSTIQFIFYLMSSMKKQDDFVRVKKGIKSRRVMFRTTHSYIN